MYDTGHSTLEHPLICSSQRFRAYHTHTKYHDFKSTCTNINLHYTKHTYITEDHSPIHIYPIPISIQAFDSCMLAHMISSWLSYFQI